MDDKIQPRKKDLPDLPAPKPGEPIAKPKPIDIPDSLKQKARVIDDAEPQRKTVYRLWRSGAVNTEDPSDVRRAAVLADESGRVWVEYGE